jgi:predicted AAA+ superfamily ATPase
MYRTAIEELHKWKRNEIKKPLINRGARQVGKTWLMKEFGRVAFEKTVYISFDNNQRMKDCYSS